MTSDVLQASYKLVEKPTEEKPLTAAQEQQKATRAHAVVQGITPAQPAPMKAEAAPPSMFGKIVSWFKSLSEEEQPKAKPPASRPRNASRPDRGERPEGGGKRRDRGGRGERGEKGERSEGGGNRDRNEPRSGQKPARSRSQVAGAASAQATASTQSHLKKNRCWKAWLPLHQSSKLRQAAHPKKAPAVVVAAVAAANVNIAKMLRKPAQRWLRMANLSSCSNPSNRWKLHRLAQDRRNISPTLMDSSNQANTSPCRQSSPKACRKQWHRVCRR